MMTESLHYDYIRPQALPLNRFLFRLRVEGEFRKRYLADAKAVVAEVGLSAAEREAVLARDIPRLVGLGAHPMLAILLRIFADIDERPGMYEYY